MIYFHCILLTLFLSGNAINLESRLRFLQDFVSHQEKSTSIVSLIPSTGYGKLKFHKEMGFENVKVGYSKDISTVAVTYELNLLFLLDLEQENAIEELLNAQQLKLLQKPSKWIIFFETQKNNDTNFNGTVADIQTMKNQLEHQLDDVYIAIDTEVYIALELKEGKLYLYLVYKKRPYLELEWELYAKWHNGFDRPKPAEVLAMRRRDHGGINVTAVTVVMDLHSYDHMPDYLFREVDIASKLVYYLTLHLFEWLNATGQINFTDSWGYQRSDGTFDGAVREMAEERCDFSGTLFYMMMDRLKWMEFVMAPSKAEPLLVFKKPSLASITNIYVLPFSKNVWLSTAGLFLVSILFLTLASMSFLHSGSRKFLGQTLSQSSIDTIAIVFQQGTESDPVFVCSRQILILGLLSFMFLFTAYSANVVALLQTTTDDINSVEALLNSPMQYGSQDLIYNHHIFEHETRPVHRELWLKKGLPQGDKFYLSTQEGIRKVRQGMYAFHVELVAGFDEIQRTFNENEKCHFGILKYITFPYPHFAISRTSRIKEQLRIGALRMKENGVQSRSNRRTTPAVPQCDSSTAIFSAVGIVDVAPAFNAMLIVYGIAVLLLCVELLVQRLGKGVELGLRKVR